MATEPQQVLMVEGSLADDGTVLVTQAQTAKDDEVEAEVSADILQQALQEATEQFEDQTNVEYDDVENAVAVVHGIEPPQSEVPEEGEENLNEEDEVQDAEEAGDETLDLVEEGETQDNDNDAEYTNDSVTSSSEVASGRVRILTSLPQRSEGSNPQAPIGSSANPIQIIQQGNTYHSTQVLSQEQLQQIAQVLQQQQQLSQSTPNGSTSVLYNAATNTRIVYRIIYPSELHSKGPATSPTDSASKNTSSGSVGRGRGRPRKPWGKRFEDPEEKVEVPELSREEKEEKKKHRPRTRSGRISKPPKYMVKDYKRIHHLDFDDEPYDDSDGGYSDYRLSGEDDDNSRSSSSSILIHGASGKPRKYKCRTCNKAYIGKGGLARHYRLNTGHGNAEELEAEVNASNNASLDGLPGSGPATPASINESQASNDGSMFATQEPVPTPRAFTPRVVTTSTPAVVVKRGRGRPSNRELASVRRKAKLKELVKQCENEELMETVLPRLAEVVSVWEFLLMKCEQGTPACPFVPDICKELEDLLKQAQKMAQEFLSLMPEEFKVDAEEENQSIVQLSNEHLAHALGLPIGCYEAKAMQEEKAPSFRYKMLTTDPSEVLRNQTTRRTVEIVAPDDLVVESPRKRMRMDEGSQSVDDTSRTMDNNIPDQMLNDGPEESLDFSNLNQTINPPPDTSEASRSAEISDSQQNAETVQQTELVDEGGADADAQQMLHSSNEAEEYEIIHATPNEDETMLNATEMACVDDGNAAEEAVQESADVIQMEVDEIKEENDDETVGEADEGLTQVQEIEDGTVITTDDENNRIISLTGEGQQFITQDGQIITMQDSNGQAILGQVICQGSDGDVIRQVMIQDGQIVSGAHIEGLTDLTEVAAHNLVPSNVLIVQNADGSTTTLQLPSDQNIPLETVQALLAMDAESQAQLLTPTTQLSDE